MTSLVEFIAGNVLALIVVVVVGGLALAVFTLGGGSRERRTPRRPITSAEALVAEEPSARADSGRGRDERTDDEHTRAEGSGDEHSAEERSSDQDTEKEV